MKKKKLVEKLGIVKIKKFHIDNIGCEKAILIAVSNSKESKEASKKVCLRASRIILNLGNYEII